MAGENLLIRLLLDANSYDRGMAQATKSVQKFVQNNMSLGGVMEGVGKTLGAFGAAVGVAGGALAAAQKTIASTQTLTDAFGRSMEGAKSAVDSFFYSVAKGDFSGFISGLQDTVKYAKQAYDALDDLGTFQIFAGAQGAEIKQQREDLKAQIKTGYSYSVDAEGNVTRNKLSDQQIADAKHKLKEVETQYIQLIQQTVEKERTAYKSLSRSILTTNQFKGTEDDIDAAVAYYLANYNNYSQASDKYKQLTATIKANSPMEQVYNQLSGAMEWRNVPNAIAQKIINSTEYNNLSALNEIGDENLQKLMQHRVSAAMAQATLSGELRSDAKVLGSGAAGGGGDKWRSKYGIGPAEDTKKMLTETEVYIMEMEDDIEFKELEMLDLTEEVTMNLAKAWENYTKELAASAAEVEDIIGGTGDVFKQFGALVGGTTGDNIAALGQFCEAAQGMVPVIEQLVAAQKLEELQSLSSTGAKLGEAAAGAGNAVANIPYVGPALALAAITSILGMAGAIKSLKFAEGGVVPGNNYTDGIGAKVSAGEVVLNSHDAKNLYDSIHSGNIGGGGGGGYVSGENIYIGVNNYLKRSGKGQLVVR